MNQPAEEMKIVISDAKLPKVYTVNSASNKSHMLVNPQNQDDQMVESPNAQSEILSSDEEAAQEGLAREPSLFKWASEEDLALIV